MGFNIIAQGNAGQNGQPGSPGGMGASGQPGRTPTAAPGTTTNPRAAAGAARARVVWTGRPPQEAAVAGTSRSS